MKKQHLMMFSMLMVCSASVWSNEMQAATVSSQPAAVQLQTQLAKDSYAIGVDLGRNIKVRGVAVDPDVLLSGLKAGLNNTPTLMTDAEIQQTLSALQKQVLQRREAELNTLKTKNKATGDAFLAANRTKPGVVTLPDGLQYKIVQAGNGVQPTEKDTVTVNYVGTTIDGKEFDNSYKRGKPVTFPLAEMIPGWIEVLKLMKAGSTWEVYIPAALAYGEQGAPPFVGPNEVLIFKINLVSVEKAK